MSIMGRCKTGSGCEADYRLRFTSRVKVINFKIQFYIYCTIQNPHIVFNLL